MNLGLNVEAYRQGQRVIELSGGTSLTPLLPVLLLVIVLLRTVTHTAMKGLRGRLSKRCESMQGKEVNAK